MFDFGIQARIEQIAIVWVCVLGVIGLLAYQGWRVWRRKERQ